MAYKILNERSAAELTTKINGLVALGWLPNIFPTPCQDEFGILNYVALLEDSPIANTYIVLDERTPQELQTKLQALAALGYYQDSEMTYFMDKFGINHYVVVYTVYPGAPTFSQTFKVINEYDYDKFISEFNYYQGLGYSVAYTKLSFTTDIYGIKHYYTLMVL